jgi:hypothetical protein
MPPLFLSSTRKRPKLDPALACLSDDNVFRSRNQFPWCKQVTLAHRTTCCTLDSRDRDDASWMYLAQELHRNRAHDEFEPRLMVALRDLRTFTIAFEAQDYITYNEEEEENCIEINTIAKNAVLTTRVLQLLHSMHWTSVEKNRPSDGLGLHVDGTFESPSDKHRVVELLNGFQGPATSFVKFEPEDLQFMRQCINGVSWNGLLPYIEFACWGGNDHNQDVLVFRPDMIATLDCLLKKLPEMLAPAYQETERTVGAFHAGVRFSTPPYFHPIDDPSVVTGLVLHIKHQMEVVRLFPYTRNSLVIRGMMKASTFKHIAQEISGWVAQSGIPQYNFTVHDATFMEGTVTDSIQRYVRVRYCDTVFDVYSGMPDPQ